MEFVECLCRRLCDRMSNVSISKTVWAKNTKFGHNIDLDVIRFLAVNDVTNYFLEIPPKLGHT